VTPFPLYELPQPPVFHTPLGLVVSDTCVYDTVLGQNFLQ
jgi:hypothetical protein